MITYQTETFGGVIDEAQPLLERHYQEVALHKERLPLKPSRADYWDLERAGRLLVITAREEGALVGYISAIIGRRLHNATVIGSMVDVIWIAPEHRNIGVGNAIFDYLEAVLSRRGAKTLQCNSKITHPALGFLLDARGYERIEIAHSRFLPERPE